MKELCKKGKLHYIRRQNTINKMKKQNKKAERILTPYKRNEEDDQVRKSQPIPSGIIQVGKLDPIIEVDEEEGLP